MTPPLYICSEPAALVALAQHPTWALLSIRDDGRDPLRLETREDDEPAVPIPHTGPRLDLTFDDWPMLDPYGRFAPPRIEHAHAIVVFADMLGDAPGVIVHCAAGISRSSAAAVGVLAVLAPDADPVDALEAARAATQAAGHRDGEPVRPNPRLVALLDLALGREWALFERVFGHYSAGRPSARTYDAEFHRLDAQS